MDFKDLLSQKSIDEVRSELKNQIDQLDRIIPIRKRLMEAQRDITELSKNLYEEALKKVMEAEAEDKFSIKTKRLWDVADKLGDSFRVNLGESINQYRTYYKTLDIRATFEESLKLDPTKVLENLMASFGAQNPAGEQDVFSLDFDPYALGKKDKEKKN